MSHQFVLKTKSMLTRAKNLKARYFSLNMNQNNCWNDVNTHPEFTAVIIIMCMEVIKIRWHAWPYISDEDHMMITWYNDCIFFLMVTNQSAKTEHMKWEWIISAVRLWKILPPLEHRWQNDQNTLRGFFFFLTHLADLFKFWSSFVLCVFFFNVSNC